MPMSPVYAARWSSVFPALVLASISAPSSSAHLRQLGRLCFAALLAQLVRSHSSRLASYLSSGVLTVLRFAR